MNCVVNKFNTYSDKLNSFDEEQSKSILRGKNNIIIKSKEELIYYVFESFRNKNSNKNLYLGVIPDAVILKIVKGVTDINHLKRKNLFNMNKKYQLTVNQEEIRHMKKDSLREIDIVNFILYLDDIVTNFDTVRYCIYNNNQKALRFKKKYDSTYITLTIISNKYHTLRTQTLFISKEDLKIKRNLSPSLNEL